VNVRLTGPTPMPPAVAAAVGAPVMSHRSAEFRSLQRRVEGRLRTILGCRAADAGVVLLTCSGTGGLEAALVNTLEPGDRVLACPVGLFGERFAAMAEAAGLAVDRWEGRWGEALDPQALADHLAAGPVYQGVLLTHNETSTGVLNPLADLARAVHAHSDALVLVDAVSSAGAVAVDLDDLDLDVVVTASQKALMAPPGVAVVALGPRAVAATYATARPRSYFDLRLALEQADEGTSTFTPCLPAYYGLDVSTSLILDEGLPAVFDRHRRVRDALRQDLAEAHVPLLVPRSSASPTVTSIVVPGSPDELRRGLRDRHGVVVSGGRGELAASTVRVGHMGHVDVDEVRAVARAIGEELTS
jgi:aspartate aminotransferase-like enzyme